MSTARLRKTALAALLTTWVGVQSGCCHHYCMNQQANPCAPLAAQPSVIRYGAVCEAPSEGTVLSGTPRSVVSADAPRPRIVVSRPGSGGLAQGGWRRADPESLATTRLEGAIDDEARRR